MDGPSDKPARPAGSSASLPHDPMLWPVAAMKFATDAMFWWLDQGARREAVDDKPDLPWTTSNKVALELSTMRLRDFSRANSGQAVLICGPYALHSTLIADFAP